MSDEATAGQAGSQSTGTVDEAALRFERLLSGEETPRKQSRSRSEAVEKPAEATPETEVEAADDGAEAQETAPEGSEDQEGDEAETSTDATEDEAEDGEQGTKLFTVKVDGKEMQVPLDELLNGYSRTADYHRKTEALANERKSFYGEVEQVRAERAQYAQVLPMLAQQIQSAMPQPPDPALRETDPLRYVIEKDAYDERVGQMQTVYAEASRLQAVQHQEGMRQLQAHVAQSFQKLPELVPAWKDKAVYERDRVKLRSYLKEVGYTDDEINQAYDPRAVANAYKAMKWDNLQKSRPRPDQPLERALRPVPAPVQQASRKTRENQVARKRLAESGRVEDAALAIRSLL